jgi:hypothetical protein
MPSQNMPVQGLKVAILPLDSTYSRLTHSGEILTTGKLHKKKPAEYSVIMYNFFEF